jgi:hypothetical protein
MHVLLLRRRKGMGAFSSLGFLFEFGHGHGHLQLLPLLHFFNFTKRKVVWVSKV